MNDDTNIAKIGEKVDFSFMKNKVVVKLNDIVLSTINDSIDMIFEDSYFLENFCINDIEDLIKDIISEGFSLEISERDQFIEEKIDALRENAKKEVHNFIIQVPIYNLSVDSEVNFGNVKFFVFNKELEKNLLEKTDDERILFYTEPNINKTLAEFKITGTKDFALYSSISNINLVLNCFKLFISKDNSKFKVKGTINENIDRTYYIFDSNDSDFLYLNRENNGVFFDTIISKDFINKKELQFIDSILKKSKRSQLEENLLSAIAWYGEAWTLYSDEHKFLSVKNNKKITKNFQYHDLGTIVIKLFTSLESILIINKNEQITENLSERITFLLGEDYDSRLRIKKDIKNLYSIRSVNVHNGNSFVSKKDLDMLFKYTRLTLLKLINLFENVELKTGDDLKNYIDQLKYS